MATITSTDVGMPVEIITDVCFAGSLAEDIITTADVGIDVKYVPTDGGTDDV